MPQVPNGRIAPVVNVHFPFDQAIEALGDAAQGRAKGKIIIQAK